MGGILQGWGAWLLGAAAVAVVAVGGFFILKSPEPEPAPPSAPAVVSPDAPVDAPENDPAPEDSAAEAPATPEAPDVPAAATPLTPSFDVVRIRPDGGAVVAGRTEPSVPVAVLIDDLMTAETKADGDGNFVALFDLPPGEATRVMTLRATLPDGSHLLSEKSVIVEAVAPVEVARAPEPEPQPVERPTPAVEPAPSPDTGTVEAPVESPADSPAESPDVAVAQTPDRAADDSGDAPVAAPPEQPAAEDRPEQDPAEDAAPDVVVAEAAPADAPGDQPAETPVDQPDASPGDQPADTPEDQPATTPGEQPAVAPDVAAAPETIEPAPTADTAPDDVAALDGAPEAAPPGAPDVMLDAAAPDTPRVLLAGPDGITVLQDRAPEAPRLSIDTISYGDGGEVALAGRGGADRQLRIYLDNRPVTGVAVGPDGQWRAPLPEVAPGIYTLRVDAVTEDGSVTSRVETPFKREDPVVLEAAQAEAEAATDAGSRIASITVQKDDTLWAIARDRYGEGMLYVKVFEANRTQIRDPHWIYPGQVFTLPDDQTAPDVTK